MQPGLLLAGQRVACRVTPIRSDHAVGTAVVRTVTVQLDEEVQRLYDMYWPKVRLRSLSWRVGRGCGAVGKVALLHLCCLAF